MRRFLQFTVLAAVLLIAVAVWFRAQGRSQSVISFHANSDQHKDSSASAVLSDPSGKSTKASVRSTPVVSPIQQKLQSIIIPIIDIEDSTVGETLDFLRMRVMECGHLEVEMVEERFPPTDSSEPEAPDPPIDSYVLDDSGLFSQKPVNLLERNISAWNALQIVARQMDYKVEIIENRVVLRPKEEAKH